MKISQKLPQFNTETGLLIVSGKMGAEFLLAKQGQTDKIDSIEIEKPHYLDREGFFESSGRGVSGAPATYRSGSVLEDKDAVIKRDFIKEFIKKIKSIFKKYKIDNIYLYCPDYMVGEIKQALLKTCRCPIKMVFIGNYNKKHFFDLLKEIDKKNEAKIVEIKGAPQTEEESKILEKSGKVTIY